MLRVEIRWIDSGAWHSGQEHGWQTREKIMSEATLSEVSTVGWLMGDDEDTYYVANSHIPGTDTFYGTQLIYKPNVISVTRLRARTPQTLEDTLNGREEDQDGEDGN